MDFSMPPPGLPTTFGLPPPGLPPPGLPPQGIQGDQLNMAVFSGTVEKLTCTVYMVAVTYAEHFLLGTRKTRPCLSGHPVQCFL